MWRLSSHQLSVMLSTLQATTPGHMIQDSTKKISVLQHIISWVNDTANKEDLPREMDSQTQIQHISQILLQWRRLLRITGGDLELSKTVVYIIDYVFSEGGIPSHYQTKQNYPGDIVLPLKELEETQEVIERKEAKQTERYVGVRVSLNGQMSTEFEYTLNQAKMIMETLVRAYLTRPEAALAYHSRSLSVIGFYLPITKFSKQQFNKIQIPL